MKKARSSAVAVGFAVLVAGASAQSFALRVDPRLFDSGGYFAANPQSTTFGAGSSGIATFVAAPRGAGFMSTSATVTANIVDANNGGINFNDGYNVVNAPTDGGVDIGFFDPAATSEYSFSSATPILVTVNWTTTVTSIVNGTIDPTAFGLQDVYVGLDGNFQFGPPGFPAASSGTFTFNAGAGNHVLAFDDASNLGGFLGTRTGSINEQLVYSIESVPEPPSLGILALGAFGLILRRRSRKA